MRKKPTFVELANATLVENSLSPLQLPYCPTNDASHASADLQAMTATLEAQQQRGEDIRAETVQEARNLGVDPTILEQMAQGVMSNTSQMHQEMMQQQQNAAAAQQRMNALHHEDMSRQNGGHAASHCTGCRYTRPSCIESAERARSNGSGCLLSNPTTAPSHSRRYPADDAAAFRQPPNSGTVRASLWKVCS